MFNFLIDNAIKRAEENGELDNLPGSGKPLKPEKSNAELFATAYGESDAMTPFGQTQRKIDSLREKLNKATDSDEKHDIQFKMARLETEKAIHMETWKRYS